jgi:hypothetical protein
MNSDLPLIMWLGPGADRSSELLGAHDTFSSRVNLMKYGDSEELNSGMMVSDMNI